MENQYFIFKIKNEYMPNYIINNNLLKHNKWSIYSINLKDFRKLKIQNIEGTISTEDKRLVEYLINDNFTHLLTQKEYEEKTKYFR